MPRLARRRATRSRPLYLLEPTEPRDRWITQRLYDARPDCRVAQEILLGIGGVRALRALHLPVDVYHFNEGHAVFAGLELIADRMEAGRPFREAWRAARERIVFTTHTPVPAGNEVHPLADLRRLGRRLRAGAERAARDRRRSVQHDGGRAAPGAPGQRGGRSSTARPRARCGRT